MRDKDNIFSLYLESAQKSKPEKDEYGNIYWRSSNGSLHREDGPAVEQVDGTKRWFVRGYKHRIGGPAVELADGTKIWYQRGSHHRVDGPAMEYPDGSRRWYRNNMLHRLDGPAVEDANGDISWFIADRYYQNINNFAKASLDYQKKPSDLESVKQFIKQLMSRRVKDVL